MKGSFNVKPNSVDELNSFQVYDKWGTKMFSTSQKHATWDGSFRGSYVNPGTFLYKVRYVCGGQDYFKSGSFVLIR